MQITFCIVSMIVWNWWKIKGGQKMNNSDYLTETEKFLFGYIEHIPSEYPPYEEEWDNEELEAIEELNEIFNL